MLKRVLGKITSFIFYILLLVRYKVSVENLEVLDGKGGLLILPNHPALIDPIILTGILGKILLFSPVISKEYSHLPVLSSIFSYFGAEYIDNSGSQEEFHKTMKSINHRLSNKENILLYPAGELCSQGSEFIGGKKMTYFIGKQGKYDRVIGVKITGLWGSIWSKAITGKTPGIGKNLLLSLYYVLINFIFFIPKRKITVSFHDITKEVQQWSLQDNLSFNKNLQSFYNNHTSNTINYISHYFYNDDTSKGKESMLVKALIMDPKENKEDMDNEELNGILGKIEEIIGEIKKENMEKMSLGTRLILDLGMDSLDMMELKVLIQKRFSNASDPKISQLETIRDVMNMSMGKLEELSLIQGISKKEFFIARGLLRSISGKNVGLLLSQKDNDDIAPILSSLNKVGVQVELTKSKERFHDIYVNLDSGIIITSLSKFNSINEAWFAYYERNIFFIEDIWKKRGLKESCMLLAQGLIPPYKPTK